MYHKVARIDRRSLVKGHYVSPGLFARQMKVLQTLGFTSVGLDALFESPMPAKPIVITFDDGYQNFAENALPTLQKHGFESTVFLVSNQLGGTNAWDVKLGDVEEKLMDVETVLACQRAGTQFGSHTADHADLTAISDDEAWKQIASSKESLEDALGAPVRTFCYPYGRKNAASLEMVRRAGYRLACSTEKGSNDSSTNRFALKRINVRSDTWSPVFLLKLMRTARDGS
jgi:peptidoglycan/xylan/chitin deacetylase (PgdA/CDA1 family)